MVDDCPLPVLTAHLYLSIAQDPELKYHLLHKVPWLGSHRSRLLSGVKKREDGAERGEDSFLAHALIYCAT